VILKIALMKNVLILAKICKMIKTVLLMVALVEEDKVLIKADYH
jgi:hypothetical protein